MKKFLIFIIIIIILLPAKYFFISWLDRYTINQSLKTCLVTGASSGIGYEISKEMVKQGWKVIGIARRKENLEKIKHELGNSFIPYVCDVSISEQIHNVSIDIKKQELKPILFFLNAGTATGDTKFEPMLNKHQQTFNTNYFGVIGWIDEWVNDLKNWGGGTFVATSSVMAIFGGSPGYCASKAAINSCFNALRLQYFYDNIVFIIVMPGPVDTDMLKTPRPLPFTHKADDEAKYIIEQVFNGKKQIEPSWFYSTMLRFISFLPDFITVKILGS